MRPRRLATVVAPCVALLAACQDYPFDFRATQRVEAQRVDQLVATLTPVDILFMIDGSPTMREETDELKNNVERFVTALAAEKIDFQIGIVTPDVECNLPNRVCTGAAGSASTSCCAIKAAAGQPVCQDRVNNVTGNFDTSDCEAGRLQGATQRVFTPPADADRAQWVSDFVAAINFALHGLSGSAYEAGIEAVSMAVACAVGSPDCTDVATGNALAVQQLNGGFVRDNADLVVIFLTDEDDCSTGDRNIYLRPANPSSSIDQAAHFCSPDECYAYYNAGHDANGNGLDDWCDPATTTNPALRLSCTPSSRVVNPPPLADYKTFLDKLVSYKTSLRQVRGAAIISAVQMFPGAAFTGEACYAASSGPSADCGCLSGGTPFACEVTGANGQSSLAIPVRSPVQDSGCTTAPGNRYVKFLNELGDRRATAGFSRDVLVDSICQTRYDATLDAIVNTVIIPRCFQLSATPSDASYLTVRLNGNVLPNVPEGSTKEGWSWAAGSREICLEGGLKKNVGDRFEILQVTATQ